MRRMQYYECPYCGSHLDYGEKCDCREEEAKKEDKTKLFFESALMIEKDGQIRMAV